MTKRNRRTALRCALNQRPSWSATTVLLLAVLVLTGRLPADSPRTGNLDYDDVKVGQRLRLIRTNGAAFTGTVIEKTNTAIRLELSAEEDGLDAWFAFPKKYLKTITRLEPLTETQKNAALEARKKEREEALAKFREALAARSGKTPQTETEKPEPTLEDRPTLTDRQLQLLTVFPTASWGPQRLQNIRQQWILRDLAPSRTESVFISIYPEWTEAAAQLQRLQTWEDQNRGLLLLERFSPQEGWTPERQTSLVAKRDAGAQLEPDEAEFLQNYADWLDAYQDSQKPTEPAGTEPAAETPQEPEGPETHEEAPAEPRTEPAEPND